MDKIFTGENKKQAEFLTFFEVYVFPHGIFAGLWVNFLVLLSHIPYKNTEELPLACLYLKFSLGYDYPHLLLYKRLGLCEMFFPRIRFVSDKHRVSQNIAKNGEHCIVDFQLKLRHVNVCTGGDLCSPFFSNFSETPRMKVSFDVRISRWEITFSFVFQDFASTCGEQPFNVCSHAPGTAHCLGATH